MRVILLSESFFFAHMLRLIVLFVCTLCVAFVNCQDVSCFITYSADSNSTLDISDLYYDPSAPSPTSYSYNATDGSQNTYYVNFCGAVSSSLACSKSGASGACQISAGTVYSAGLVSTMANATFTASGTGGALIYTQGDACPGQGQNVYRETTINVICDESQDPGTIMSEISSGCDYTIKYVITILQIYFTKSSF